VKPLGTSFDKLDEISANLPHLGSVPEPKHTGAHIAVAGGIPDARWINRHLKIADVADARGCKASLGKLHCWHPERHKNEDRTPSVGIKKTANRVKCFGCAGDSKYMSVIDLVMDFPGVDVSQAIRWLAERYKIPQIPKGTHLKEPNRPRFEVGKEGPMEMLVRSGIWEVLSPPAHRIFPVLLCFAEFDGKRRYVVMMSYLGMQRHSGIKSPNAAKAGFKCLRDCHLLEWAPVRGETQPFLATAKYLLTPHADEFQELANAVAAEQRTAIEVEREYRKHARSERLKKIETQRGRWTLLCTKYNTLYPADSA
jgi:hypothetical protein